MQIIKELHCDGSILALFCDEDGICTVTNSLIVNFYDLEFNKIYMEQIAVKEDLHQFSKAVALAQNNTLVVPSNDQKHIALYNFKYKLQKALQTIDLDEQLEVTLFSNNAKLFICGDIDGRCKIFREQNLIATLKPKPDYINALALSEDNRFLLYSSYNKSLSIYDIKRSREYLSLLCDDVLASAYFIDNQLLLLALQNGALLLYDLQKKEKIFQKNLLNFWPTCIFKYNKKYLIIATRDIPIYFFNIETQEVEFSYRMPYKGVTSISMNKNYIYFTFQNGVVQIIDTRYKIDEFEIALKVENIAEVNSLLSKNIFLRMHPKYVFVSDISFETDFQKALKQIAISHPESAKKIMNEHKGHEKYGDFEYFISHPNFIVNFYNAVNQRDLTTAFLLLNDIKALKKTQAYAQLEIIWVTTFKKVKLLLQEDAVLNYRKAENLIRPFLKIQDKKAMIANLFNNIDIFTKADEAIKSRDFKKYFAYVQKYDFLTGTEIYDKVLAMGEKICTDMLEFENLIRYDKAIEYAKELQPFPMYKNEILALVTRIKIKKQFGEYVLQKDFNRAFLMMDTYDYVQTLPKAIRLEAKLQADIEKAQQTLSKPKDVLQFLSTYLEFTSCRELIATTLEQKYIQEMYKYADRDIIDWFQVFRRYLSIYNESNEIKKFAALSAKETILEKAKDHFKFIGVKKVKFPNTILIKKRQKATS